jgi:uncharacterized membrane protein
MMYAGFCNVGDWGSLANFGGWGWIGLILNLVLWVGLIGGFALLIVWAVRRAQAPVTTVPSATGQLSALEILQALYAQGAITREQYELRKRDIG